MIESDEDTHSYYTYQQGYCPKKLPWMIVGLFSYNLQPGDSIANSETTNQQDRVYSNWTFHVSPNMPLMARKLLDSTA